METKDKFFYTVEIWDKDKKLYKDRFGNKVTKIAKFSDNETDENLIGMICEHQVKVFEAVCKEGSQIDVTVHSYNNISNTYSLAYSYYGLEKRFIKH